MSVLPAVPIGELRRLAASLPEGKVRRAVVFVDFDYSSRLESFYVKSMWLLGTSWTDIVAETGPIRSKRQSLKRYGTFLTMFRELQGALDEKVKIRFELSFRQ